VFTRLDYSIHNIARKYCGNISIILLLSNIRENIIPKIFMHYSIIYRVFEKCGTFYYLKKKRTFTENDLNKSCRGRKVLSCGDLELDFELDLGGYL